MKRIGIAGFLQESNSFSPNPAVLDDFTVFDKACIRGHFEDTNSELGGFLEACAAAGWEAVPLFAATASSGGPLTAGCFEELLRRLVTAVASERCDGILLALHGAMSSEEFASADAEVVRRIREVVGPGVPLVVTHDLHANVSPQILRHADALTGYRTYPHVDQKETALRAGSLLSRLLAGNKATRWHLSIPLLLPPQVSGTSDGPLKPVMDSIQSAFDQVAGCDATLFCVQPWLDLESAASSLVVTDFSGLADLPRAACTIARDLWSRRRRFSVPWIDADDLMSSIRGAGRKPVLVSEGYDAPSAGAAGDHTGLLRCLLPHAKDLAACVWIVDGQAAQQIAALGSGIGASIEVEIGAKVDRRFSSPVRLYARVENITDGAFTFRGPAFHGLAQSMGTTAVLAASKVRVLVSSRPVFCIDPEMYRSQGIEPSEQDAVGIKSPTLFRPAYRDISTTVLHLDLPGPCRGRFETLLFRNISHPMWPLDDAEWNPLESDVLRFD